MLGLLEGFSNLKVKKPDGHQPGRNRAVSFGEALPFLSEGQKTQPQSVGGTSGAWEVVGFRERGFHCCSAALAQPGARGEAARGDSRWGQGPWQRKSPWVPPSPVFTRLPRERRRFDGPAVTSEDVCLAESALCQTSEFQQKSSALRKGWVLPAWKPSPSLAQAPLILKTTREWGYSSAVGHRAAATGTVSSHMRRHRAVDPRGGSCSLSS